MNILLEIDSDPFVIYARDGSLWAHHLRSGRDYPLATIAPLHPDGVRRALQSLVENEALAIESARRFLEQHLPWMVGPVRVAA